MLKLGSVSHTHTPPSMWFHFMASSLVQRTVYTVQYKYIVYIVLFVFQLSYLKKWNMFRFETVMPLCLWFTPVFTGNQTSHLLRYFDWQVYQLLIEGKVQLCLFHSTSQSFKIFNLSATDPTGHYAGEGSHCDHTAVISF